MVRLQIDTLYTILNEIGTLKGLLHQTSKLISPQCHKENIGKFKILLRTKYYHTFEWNCYKTVKKITADDNKFDKFFKYQDHHKKSTIVISLAFQSYKIIRDLFT